MRHRLKNISVNYVYDVCTYVLSFVKYMLFVYI